jgi:hypothetical protein
MSSINGDAKNRNNADETIRRSREEYRRRESDLAKKHNKEIRRLTEAHRTELKKVKEGHSERMREAQETMNENITRRDSYYKKQIEDLRKLHRDQVRTSMDSADRKIESARTALAKEKEMSQRATDSKIKDLSHSSNTMLVEKEKRHQESIERLREIQKNTIFYNVVIVDHYHRENHC